VPQSGPERSALPVEDIMPAIVRPSPLDYV
jgi:hypothetical protein